MEPEFLEVEVNGLAGHLCHLHLNRRQRLSVQDLKTTIEEHCSIAAVEQRLFLNSTELFSTEQLLNSSGRELTLVRRSSLQVQWLQDLVMKAVKQYPDALEFIPKHFLKDPDVIRCAVESDGTCLSYAHEDLRGDVDLVFAAVQQEGMALEYASEELQADRRLVLAALRADGSALQFAGDALREDEEVVYAALRSDGLALEFAHPSKRSDKELVLFAIRKELIDELDPVGVDAGVCAPGRSQQKELIDELDPVSANRYRDALSEDEAGEVEVTIWHAGL